MGGGQCDHAARHPGPSSVHRGRTRRGAGRRGNPQGARRCRPGAADGRTRLLFAVGALMDDIAPATPDLAQGIEAVLPLTPMQQGMLFHSLLDPASAVFFQQLVADLDGEMSEAAFAAAWDGLMARHQSLRMAFLWE